MNSKTTFPFFLWLLGLFTLAIVAIEPLLALGYNQIVFIVVPALQAVNATVFGY
jgi:hypothetical protein